MFIEDKFYNQLFFLDQEIKLEWGKGLAQKREAEARLQELELEKEKPFARTRYKSSFVYWKTSLTRNFYLANKLYGPEEHFLCFAELSQVVKC